MEAIFSVPVIAVDQQSMATDVRLYEMKKACSRSMHPDIITIVRNKEIHQ
jgi:hypothetical protein